MDTTIMTFAALKQALLYAEQAVAADRAGDYPTAQANYQQALSILSAEAPRVPEASRGPLRDKIAAYQRRVELLQALAPKSAPSSAKRSDKSDKNIQNAPEFVPESIPAHVSMDPPPEDIYEKPFWTVREVMRSLQTGLQLNDACFVPKSVWFQQGATIEFGATKVAVFFHLLELLQKLKQQRLDDSTNLYAEMKAFNWDCHYMQGVLASNLPYIQKTKIDMKAAHPLKKLFNFADNTDAKTESDAGIYSKTLLSILKECLFLQDWYRYFSHQAASSENQAMVIQIAKFFQDVVCNIAMHDLESLTDKYLKANMNLLFPM